MSHHTSSRKNIPQTRNHSSDATSRVIVLHDDHLTAQRGRRIARSIAGEMGLDDSYEIVLWNVDLLGTLFGRVAALEASTADIVIVALRSGTQFTLDLKTWVLNWLTKTKNKSAALITVLDNPDDPAAIKARSFIEGAASDAGKDFFSQHDDHGPGANEMQAHEFLWVL